MQSLRARTEESLTRKEVQNADSDREIKQVLSFTLTEKVPSTALYLFVSLMENPCHE